MTLNSRGAPVEFIDALIEWKNHYASHLFVYRVNYCMPQLVEKEKNLNQAAQAASFIPAQFCIGLESKDSQKKSSKQTLFLLFSSLKRSSGSFAALPMVCRSFSY